MRVRGGLNLDPQFMGKAQELLGASRAFNTMKVTKSALAKVTQAELLFGIDLSFPWSLSDAANFVMACIELQLKANSLGGFGFEEESLAKRAINLSLEITRLDALQIVKTNSGQCNV